MGLYYSLFVCFDLFDTFTFKHNIFGTYLLLPIDNPIIHNITYHLISLTVYSVSHEINVILYSYNNYKYDKQVNRLH